MVRGALSPTLMYVQCEHPRWAPVHLRIPRGTAPRSLDRSVVPCEKTWMRVLLMEERTSAWGALLCVCVCLKWVSEGEVCV